MGDRTAVLPHVNRLLYPKTRELICKIVLLTRTQAKKGLLVRHLVMPSYVEEGKEIMKFLAQHISRDTYVNVMEQYRYLAYF